MMTWKECRMSSLDARATQKEWIGLAVIALPCILYAMDLTVLNLAVPSLTASLQPTAAQLLWIVDIYGFFVAGSLLTMGTLGDRIGRRKLLLIGAAAFGVTSVIAAFAPTAEALILARALLGIAGATLAPSTLSLITNMFRNDRERTIAISIWVASFSTGGAIGPVVGGVLLNYFWWGSVFLVAVPIMVLLLILGPSLLPEYKDPQAGRLDLVSAALSMVAVLSIIYGIKTLAEGGEPVLSGGTILFGLAMGAVFVWRQLTLEHPLLDLSLFARPSFTAALGINVFGFFAIFGIFLVVAQYMQLVLGLTPFEAGLWSLPPGLGFVVGSLLTPVLLSRMRPAYVLALGLGLAAAGLIVMGLIAPSRDLIVLITADTVMSLGVAPVATIAADLVMSSAPPERAGAASGLNETSSEFGGALGIALLGSVLTVLYRGGLGGTLPEGLSGETVAMALRGIGGAYTAAETLPAGGAELLEAAREAYSSAMLATSLLGAVVVLVAAVTTIAVFRGLKPATA
jgi:DHA2 family multidrug resistance protein-like MFS transporter